MAAGRLAGLVALGLGMAAGWILRDSAGRALPYAVMDAARKVASACRDASAKADRPKENDHADEGKDG